MRVLFVSPYFPLPQRSGGKVRVFSILRELARTDEVTFVSYLSRESEDFVREVQRWGVDVQWLRRELRRRPLARHLRFLPTRVPFSLVDPDYRMRELVRKLWATRRYDLVQVEFLAMAYVAEGTMFAGRRFLTHHYSATDHYRRALDILPKSSARYWAQRIDAAKMPAFEGRTLEEFASVFVTSEQDRDLLSVVSPAARLVVANNGVDAEFYRSERPVADRRAKLLVSTCSFKTDANIDSVIWFLEEVWPRILGRVPEARYEIIGYEPPSVVFQTARRLRGVRILGGVDDIRPYLKRAVASLITMRAGSGTKIRALTSLAMGCPIIATPLGAEGLQAGEEQGVFVGSTPDAVASLAVRLLEGGIPASTQEGARDYVEQHHSWKRSADIMRATYREMVPR